jgi:hypothetical protein
LDPHSPFRGSDAPDVERPMIRVRPDESGSYTVERVRPGGEVAPIYTGEVGFEEAVAIGAYSGGVPPEGMQPTPAALEEAEAELASHQSTGHGTQTAAAQPAVAPLSNSLGSTEDDAAYETTVPANMVGGFGGAAQSVEPRTVQSVTQPQAVEPMPAAPEIPTYPQEPAAPSTLLPPQPPPAQTVIERAGYEPPVSGQPTASGADVDGQAYIGETTPYQPPIQTTSAEQDVTPQTLGQPLQPSAQRAGVVHAAPALPVAGTVAESPAPIPAPLSAQPAAITTIQTNTETTQNSTGGSTVGAVTPGG